MRRSRDGVVSGDPDLLATSRRRARTGSILVRMTARIANVSIHAEDPAALARFWSAAMGYPEPTGWPADEVAELKAAGLSDEDITARAEAWDDDPNHQRFYFSRYGRERRQRNRMHIDLTPFDDRRATVAEVRAESERLVALGATIEKVLDGFWGPFHEFAIMMRDPEGNEFCVQ